MRQETDWYAYLKLAADAPTGQIETAVERLSRQAAALAVTAPERSRQLRETVRAMKRDLLSGPEGRFRYDASLAAAAAAPAPAPADPVGPVGPANPADPAGPARPPAGFPPPPPAAPAAPLAAPVLPLAGLLAGGERIGARIVRFLRTGWTCSSCGKDALPSEKFCTRCGTPITPMWPDPVRERERPACVSCGAPLGVNDAFCARCGTRTGR